MTQFKNADKPRPHRQVEVLLKPARLMSDERAEELGFELVPFDDLSEDEKRGLVTGQLRDSLGAHQPLIALRESLAFDDRFKSRVEVLIAEGASDERVTETARLYARNGGRPLEVMREVIRRILAMETKDLTFAILNFPPIPGAGLDVPSTAPRWKKGGNYRSAADKIVRLGAGKCLAANCATTTLSSDRYCFPHSAIQAFEARADQEAMRNILLAVGELLGEPFEPEGQRPDEREWVDLECPSCGTQYGMPESASPVACDECGHPISAIA